MTLNKNYNKIMEEVRLTEAQKEDILSHVLARKEKPRSFVWWKALGIFTTIFVVSLLLRNLVPHMTNSGASSDTMVESATVTVEEANPEMAMDEGGVTTAGGALSYHHEVEPIEYEIQEGDHTIQINGITVYIVVDGQQAIWVKDGETHHLTVDEPMEEEAFLELIQTVME